MGNRVRVIKIENTLISPKHVIPALKLTYYYKLEERREGKLLLSIALMSSTLSTPYHFLASLAAFYIYSLALIHESQRHWCKLLRPKSLLQGGENTRKTIIPPRIARQFITDTDLYKLHSRTRGLRRRR